MPGRPGDRCQNHVMTPDVARAFGAIAYLEHLDAAERADLARSCAFRNLPAGTTLFTEGEPAPGVFLIIEGRIKVVRSSAGGREQVLHEEGVGTTLAEVPVFDGGGCVGSAIAVDDAVVFFVERQALLGALARNPASAGAVMRILAARIRKLAAVVEDLSLRTVTERAAGFLVTGISPRLALDDDYRGFLDLVAGSLAGAIGT